MHPYTVAVFIHCYDFHTILPTPYTLASSIHNCDSNTLYGHFYTPLPHPTSKQYFNNIKPKEHVHTGNEHEVNDYSLELNQFGDKSDEAGGDGADSQRHLSS